ncbi:MAG: ATP-dependent DNA helicase RecG [Ardenticatenaceae bacterium]|nr:ATP-dependent DNA helicase RecG [Ardenticatenaceae bacterium]
MGRAFKRLERVLNLEAQQGYQNKAVVGGIRQFATFWVGQAREEAQDEADRALVEQVAEVLMEYGRLPGKEARQKALESLNNSLAARRKRVSEPAAAKPAPKKQPPPPRPEPKTQPKVEKRPEIEPEVERPLPEETVEDLPVVEAEPEKPVLKLEPPAEPDPEGLSQSVTVVKGIGPRVAEKLARLNAETVWELLYIFPRRYDDYTLMKPIKDLVYGEQVTIIGTIWETRARRTRTNQIVVQSIISDGTANIQATWFNQQWLVDKLKAGMQIVLSGKVDQYLGRLVFNSPEWEPLEIDPLRTRRIVPVYPLTEGLTAKKMRDVMSTAVNRWARHIPDPLPESIRQKLDFYALSQAVAEVHFPYDQDSLYHARKRIIFDELFLLQLGMQGQRHKWQAHPGIPLSVDGAALDQFKASLPYELTGAQKRVVGEFAADMSRDKPMNRLLQGDVGAGKTVVAAAAMVVAAKAGKQAALMAPTEILAEQHYAGLSKLLDPLGIETALLTGSTSAAEKAQIYADLASGKVQVAIGTHALIQEAVTFDNLALAVIDEQHRFGVDQRQALREKGAETAVGKPSPHLLVMSATPIPRTLALSLYGDLDLSVLDEMPPGRQEIKTRWLRHSERERAYSFIRGQIAQGRQAYIIYPLVEESDKIDAKAAVEEFERLQNEVFPDLKLGLIHGRLKSDEKETAMRAFYGGETHILVATSVIEVGVDVPNSTVMLIEGANRFGLAQLHQFRGRVGRGEYQSYCILISDAETAVAEERLQALEQTNDGFILAEKDLEIRGPGEFFGRRQSGLPELKLASLLDMEMLRMAQTEAAALFAADPMLARHENGQLRDAVAHFWEQAGDIS